MKFILSPAASFALMLSTIAVFVALPAGTAAAQVAISPTNSGLGSITSNPVPAYNLASKQLIINGGFEDPVFNGWITSGAAAAPLAAVTVVSSR